MVGVTDPIALNRAAWDARGLGMAPEPDGRYRLRAGGHPLPMIFTLVARRPTRT
jgi:hypothetical protein